MSKAQTETVQINYWIYYIKEWFVWLQNHDCKMAFLYGRGIQWTKSYSYLWVMPITIAVKKRSGDSEVIYAHVVRMTQHTIICDIYYKFLFSNKQNVDNTGAVST